MTNIEKLMECARAFAEGRLFEWPLPGVIIPADKDRMIRPNESVVITGRSLASQHRDKKAGKWPPMFRIGENSVANRLSHLLILNASREIAVPIEVCPGIRKGRPRNHQKAGA